MCRIEVYFTFTNIAGAYPEIFNRGCQFKKSGGAWSPHPVRGPVFANIKGMLPRFCKSKKGHPLQICFCIMQTGCEYITRLCKTVCCPSNITKRKITLFSFNIQHIEYTIFIEIYKRNQT